MKLISAIPPERLKSRVNTLRKNSTAAILCYFNKVFDSHLKSNDVQSMWTVGLTNERVISFYRYSDRSVIRGEEYQSSMNCGLALFGTGRKTRGMGSKLREACAYVAMLVQLAPQSVYETIRHRWYFTNDSPCAPPPAQHMKDNCSNSVATALL